MNTLPVAWRYGFILAVLVLLVYGRRLPALLWVVLLGGAGAYLLYQGWQGWTGRGGAGGRVTYWRGRRIELGPPPGRLSLPASGGTLLSLAAGAVLLLTALLLLVRGRV